MPRRTVSAEEIARFDALAARWWDPNGPMRPLHRMNPARVAWIVACIERRFPGRHELRVLDVGCGAGLAAEALARRGFIVTGIDAAKEAIAAARAHGEAAGFPGILTGEGPPSTASSQAGTKSRGSQATRPSPRAGSVRDDNGRPLLAYRVATVDDLQAEGLRFPVVLALEVIEHVPDQPAFVRGLAALLEPGGLLVLSTLNRTGRAFLAAKLGAEYLLRWLPVGTHDWRRFVTPSELGTMLHESGLRVSAASGLTPDLLRGEWRAAKDMSVNYLIAADA